MRSEFSGLLRDFDGHALASEYQAAAPVPSICIDNFLDGEFAKRVARGFPSFAEAQSMGRSFNALNEKGKVQVTDSSKFAPAVLALHELLISAAFIDEVSAMCGIPGLIADPQLVGGGIHETGPRGRLDVHVDFNFIEERQLHRRLNILIYFNDPWQPEWGGDFELWNEDVSRCVSSFSPVFNRMCMFNTSEISYHGVRAVTCPPGNSRKSFAAYYYTKEAPEGWDGSVHSTRFRARPDEVVKGKLLMPLQGMRHHAKQFVKKIVGRS